MGDSAEARGQGRTGARRYSLMIPESSAAPSQRPALGLPGVMWRVRAVVYGVVYLLALGAAGLIGGGRLGLTLFMLGAGLAPFLVGLARHEWTLETSAGVDLIVGFVLWWQLPAMPGAGLAMTMWAVVLIAVATRHYVEDLLLRVAIALEVVKLLIVVFGPDRPVGAGLSEMFRAPFDEIVFALAQTGLVLGVYFAARALVRSERRRRSAAAHDERRLIELVSATPVAMVVVVSGSVAFANSAAERMLGAPQSELVGSDFFTLVPDAAVPGARAAIQQAVAADHPVAIVGERLVAADGSSLRIGLQIAPMTYAGQPAVQVALVDHSVEQSDAIALQASEERFRTAFFDSPAPIVLLDLDGSVESINPAGLELLGYASDEVIGTNWQRMVAVEETRALAGFAERALRGQGDRLSEEIRFATKDGRVIPALVNVALVKDADERALGFVGQLHDLTERYAVEHALRESEERYRNLFERIPVALYRTTTDGVIVDVNPALLELMGYEDIDVLRRRAATEVYVDPEDRTRMAKLMSDNGRVVSMEAELVRSDGSTFWARDTARVVGDKGSRYFEGAIVDVTERRRGEARLREQACLQEALALLGQIALDTTDLGKLFAESVGIVAKELSLELAGVVLRTDDGSYEPAATAGWPSEGKDSAVSRLEALARYAADQESPVMVNAVRDEADGDESLPGNGVAIALSGSAGPVGALIALGPRSGEFRPEHVHFLQSMRTILAAAIGRAAAAARLEELVRSKDEFVASISHELRTPLTVVAGMVDELNDHWQEFTADEVDDLLGHVVEESRDMQDLIEDLLVAARADIGTVSIALESIAVRETIDSVVAGLTRRPAQQLTIGGEGGVAEADPVRLRQIMRNLVSNAIRYGGDHIDVGIARENGHIHVTVKDDGAGVPEGQWDSVFEPYARAHDTAEHPNSVGLGLSVSRKLARLMGGDLRYRHEDGSVFDLSLPAASSDGEPTHH